MPCIIRKKTLFYKNAWYSKDKALISTERHVIIYMDEGNPLIPTAMLVYMCKNIYTEMPVVIIC